MNIIVGKHSIRINNEPINEKEQNITHCSFTFDEDITNDYVKEAYFTKNNTTYKMMIYDNECELPSEILTNAGKVELGVSYYKIEDDITTRYNPSSAYFFILEGSIKNNTKNGMVISTPSELEQFENEIRAFIKDVNVNISVSKSGNTTTVRAIDAEGNVTISEVYDGEQGPQGPEGPEGKQGPQGEPGPAGKDGKDGIDGKDGVDGKDGKDGQDGTNGIDGQDGYSPSASVSKSGATATITITDKNGTTTTTISDGQDGQNGQNGYTPVRGTDYWTAEDIATIDAYIDSKTTGLLSQSY